MINWQLSRKGIRWPVSPDRTAGSSVDLSRSSTFWSYPLTDYQFQIIAGLSLFFPNIHIRYVVFMSIWPRTIRILISNWPWTQKFSQFFKSTGGEDLFFLWSRVGHAQRPIFMLWLVKIWLASSCGQFMEHLESCYFDSCFVSTGDVFNCFFPPDVQNKIQLLSRVFCYSWLVCLFSDFLASRSSPWVCLNVAGRNSRVEVGGAGKCRG